MPFDFFRRTPKPSRQPAPTPPQPPTATKHDGDNDDVVQRFDAMALSGKKSDFVGGFAQGHQTPKPNSTGGFVNVRLTNQLNGNVESGPTHQSPSFPMPSGARALPETHPQPPAYLPMPVPQHGMRPSLIMQHALSAPPDVEPTLRPEQPPRPSSGSNIPSPTHLHPQTALQATPSRPRASSSPPSPVSASSKDENESSLTQCSGITKKGERCSRHVKSRPPLNFVDPDAPVLRFCFQHTKEVLGPSGFYSHKQADQWVTYADWIPDYLQPDTQAALRAEMEKEHSESDVSGYIYTFEIRDPKSPNKIDLKVGRAVNVVKRFDEWGKQCGSKEQVLRGYWPWPSEGETTLMKGRVKQGEPGPHCHRLERLVHLELADLALHTPYLSAHFPRAAPEAISASASSSSTPSTPVRSKRKSPASSPAGGKIPGKPCPDCGAIHKEIFSFTRPERGRYKGKEWELIVKPVIDKWGAFVETYV